MTQATTLVRQVRLADGFRLGYAEFGDPGGSPVFYFHGFPGSRLEAELTHEAAALNRIRIIAVDRPGYGLSEFQPDRTIAGWPADVAQMADILGIDRFAVLGLSGGGPYALACAWEIPDRLTAAGVVCGLGQLDRPGATRELGWPAHLSFFFVRNLPWLMHAVYEQFTRWIMRRHPRWVVRLMHASAPWPDRKILVRSGVRQSLVRSVHEAVRQGGRGPMRDLILYSRPWGFRLRDIAMEVDLWHGEEDATVPATMGRYQAGLIPHCRSRFLPGEGHFSLLVNHAGEILSTLKRRGKNLFRGRTRGW